MSPEAPAFGVAPQRTPVEFDPVTSGLRIGPYERRVDNPAEPSSVYGAYLSLLYAVRGAKPGERLPLRAADLEALLLIVGDDPATIEERLVGLMGCSAEEASVLGKLLLRHRKMTATLGIVAGLSLGTVGVVTVSNDQPAPAESVQSVADAPSSASGPTPISGTTQPAPATPVQVGPATTPVVVAAPQPAAPVAGAPAVAEPVLVAAPDAPLVTAPTLAAPTVVAPAVEAAAPELPSVSVIAPVEEPAYALPTYAVPVMDAPPPAVEVELPEAAIGEPAVLDADAPVEQISGVVDSGHDAVEPVGPPVPLPPNPLVDEAPVAEPVLGEPATSDTPTVTTG